MAGLGLDWAATPKAALRSRVLALFAVEAAMAEVPAAAKRDEAVAADLAECSGAVSPRRGSLRAMTRR